MTRQEALSIISEYIETANNVAGIDGYEKVCEALKVLTEGKENDN